LAFGFAFSFDFAMVQSSVVADGGSSLDLTAAAIYPGLRGIIYVVEAI